MTQYLGVTFFDAASAGIKELKQRADSRTMFTGETDEKVTVIPLNDDVTDAVSNAAQSLGVETTTMQLVRFDDQTGSIEPADDLVNDYIASNEGDFEPDAAPISELPDLMDYLQQNLPDDLSQDYPKSGPKADQSSANSDAAFTDDVEPPSSPSTTGSNEDKFLDDVDAVSPSNNAENEDDGFLDDVADQQQPTDNQGFEPDVPPAASVQSQAVAAPSVPNNINAQSNPQPTPPSNDVLATNVQPTEAAEAVAPPETDPLLQKAINLFNKAPLQSLPQYDDFVASNLQGDIVEAQNALATAQWNAIYAIRDVLSNEQKSIEDAQASQVADNEEAVSNAIRIINDNAKQEQKHRQAEADADYEQRKMTYVKQAMETLKAEYDAKYLPGHKQELANIAEDVEQKAADAKALRQKEFEQYKQKNQTFIDRRLDEANIDEYVAQYNKTVKEKMKELSDQAQAFLGKADKDHDELQKQNQALQQKLTAKEAELGTLQNSFDQAVAGEVAKQTGAQQVQNTQLASQLQEKINDLSKQLEAEQQKSAELARLAQSNNASTLAQQQLPAVQETRGQPITPKARGASKGLIAAVAFVVLAVVGLGGYTVYAQSQSNAANDRLQQRLVAMQASQEKAAKASAASAKKQEKVSSTSSSSASSASAQTDQQVKTAAEANGSAATQPTATEKNAIHAGQIINVKLANGTVQPVIADSATEGHYVDNAGASHKVEFNLN